MLSLLWLSVFLICYKNGAAEKVSMKPADIKENNPNLVNKLMEMEEQLNVLKTGTEKLEHEKLSNLIEKSRNEKRMRTMIRRMNYQQEVCKAMADDLQDLKAVVRRDEGVQDSDGDDIVLKETGNTSSKSIVRKASKRQGMFNSTRIAFSAYLTDILSGLGVNHIILFDGITINEGSGYNQYTGVFTAPESGVYLFSTFIEYNKAHRLRVKLVVNGITKSSAAVFPYTTSYDTQGGNVVILRLISGDSAWVAIDETGDSIEGSSTYKVTTFSGVYLYP